jgi:hypothetical protein
VPQIATLCGTGPALIVDSQLGEPAQQSAIKGRQHSEEGYAIWHIRTQLEDFYRLLAIHPTAYLVAKGGLCHLPR